MESIRRAHMSGKELLRLIPEYPIPFFYPPNQGHLGPQKSHHQLGE